MVKRNAPTHKALPLDGGGLGGGDISTTTALKMKRIPPPGTTAKARASRKAPTDAESRLWDLLRTAFPNARFRRQVPIRHYRADFAATAPNS